MQSKLIKIINYTSISLVFLSSLILFLGIQYPQILKNKFLIKNINIIGDDKSDKQDIENLVISQNKDLYLIKLQSLKEVIEAQEWVKKVNIKKTFPSTIEINITENDPFAVYVSDQDTYLIDIDGSFITKVNQDTYDHNLLIVRGNQSNLNLESLIKKINIHFPSLIKKIKILEFVEERRWNLSLNNNLIIKLPDENVDKSLINLKSLFIEEKILESNVIEIDLRINGRASLKVLDGEIKYGVDEI